MWPIVVAILGVTAGIVGLTIGLTLPRDATSDVVATVAATEVAANSSAAVREAGVYATTRPATVFPGALETAGVVIPQLDPAAFASDQAAKVRARYGAMAGFGSTGAQEPIVIGGFVCHQGR
jgi:hypothetical protein